jgi:Secretion system C-terminal sorting domain
MKKASLIISMLVFCTYFSFGQNDISGPIVQYPVYFDVSPPLRDIVKNLPPKADNSWKDGIVKNHFNLRQKPSGQAPGGLSDPYLQTKNGLILTDTTIVNFDGNTNTQGFYPPDTYGDVGPNHYFQVVNCHYSIYSKTGTLLLGPLDNSSIFNGMPNNSNNGDAVVLYDEQADRWLFSQFSFPNGQYVSPYYQMIAVSQTADPTGSWYRYEYSFTNMPDYPKFGVWGDGYYMSMNQFATGSSWAGSGAVAYNRTQMLAGSPSPTMIMFTKPASDEASSWLPSDCDGPFPTGTPPNYFLYVYDGISDDHLGIYEFHVDWVTPANATFGNFLSLPVTAFTANITGIPQPGTTQKLDVINDRMMYRLQYRHFSDHEALVGNHTVDVTGTTAGIRWYELRKTSGAFSIYQSGTYSLADNNSRWMGSIAQDSSGNIALGYSVGGVSLYPSIRYCGRKKNDALGTMTIGEKGIFIGTGSQTGTADRWGDYSSMTCDPSAKATFWYTQEYYATTSSTGWRTRIAEFHFPNTPIVTTLAATPITATGGTLNATVNPNGLATTYHFEWGTSASYGNVTLTQSAGSGSSDVPVSAILSGLTTGVTYHYRIDGTNSDGTVNGIDATFTPGAAIVVTTAASPVTMTTATAGGNVTTDGGFSVTARGTCWGITANPTIAGNHTTDGTGTGIFTSSITGLSSSTTYHIRAYATNGNGTFYGADLTFTTLCGNYNLPFNENFAITSIPGCWSQIDHQGNGEIWQFGTITGNYAGYFPTLTGNYAYLNSDAYGNGNSQNADLLTPLLDLSGYSTINLQFNHYFRSYPGSSGTLSYSIDGGSLWTQIQQWASSTANPAAFNQAVNAVAGQALVKFKWNYTGAWGYYWAIDDVQITGLPINKQLSNITILDGTNNCYNASQTITVAGSGTTFTVQNGGSATLIAGLNIRIMPGATVQSGGYFWGTIAPSGPFCVNPIYMPSNPGNITENNTDLPTIFTGDLFKVYPNPTTGNFILELNGDFTSSITNVEVFGMRGEEVLTTVVTGERKREFSLSDRPAGIYFIRVISGSKAASAKIIKQ